LDVINCNIYIHTHTHTVFGGVVRKLKCVSTLSYLQVRSYQFMSATGSSLQIRILDGLFLNPLRFNVYYKDQRNGPQEGD